MISIIPLVLALTSTVSGLVPHSNNFARHAIHARNNHPKPETYAQGYLEKYHIYHCRYLSLQCQDKHNTTFFNDCCHPLLATESLEKDRPAKCTPQPGPCPEDPSVQTPYDQQYKQQEKDKADKGDSPPKDKSPPEHKSGGDPPKAKVNNNSNDKPKQPDVGGGNVIKGGFATFFTQNNVAGACGTVHKDVDMIAAMNVHRYGDTGVHSPLCGKSVNIRNTKNGKSVTVIVADACPGCPNANSIDLSTGAFGQIAKPEEGMVPIEWTISG
jgi:hypothetical protein